MMPHKKRCPRQHLIPDNGDEQIAPSSNLDYFGKGECLGFISGQSVFEVEIAIGGDDRSGDAR